MITPYEYAKGDLYHYTYLESKIVHVAGGGLLHHHYIKLGSTLRRDVIIKSVTATHEWLSYLW
jgi:hypothetical protein